MTQVDALADSRLPTVNDIINSQQVLLSLTLFHNCYSRWWVSCWYYGYCWWKARSWNMSWAYGRWGSFFDYSPKPLGQHIWLEVSCLKYPTLSLQLQKIHFLYRTYYLNDSAAELEQALVRYALDILKNHGFHFMSCPNILHGSVFEGCGIPSKKLTEYVCLYVGLLFIGTSIIA